MKVTGLTIDPFTNMPVVIGAHVAPSTGKAGSSLPLNAALRLMNNKRFVC